jgi:hypothetical protein
MLFETTATVSVVKLVIAGVLKNIKSVFVLVRLRLSAQIKKSKGYEAINFQLNRLNSITQTHGLASHDSAPLIDCHKVMYEACGVDF